MQEPENSLNTLLKEADAGNLEAMKKAVAIIPLEGYLDNDKDGDIRERYKNYLQQLAESGWNAAYIMLGDACTGEKGKFIDPMEAIHYYEKAAENGIPFGNECIGMMYFTGKYIARDYAKAFAYFTKDEGKKSFCTTYALAEMYRRGLFVTRNDEKACEYYSSIVYNESESLQLDEYYWRACYRLGRAMHYGEGVERDLDAALEMIEYARGKAKKQDSSFTDSWIDPAEVEREWLLLNQETGRF